MSELTLGEIAQIVDCEHKTAPATLDEPFGYSVGTRALNGHGINLSECKPVSEETYNAWSRRAELVQGDIVFAREAPVGGLGLVDGTVPLCLGQRTVLVRPNPSLVDSRYLYYLLRSEECQRQMIEMSTGSTVLHINVADVRNFKLNEIPTLETQCAIGEILSEIEEKIKVNHKIASTLEQIAQTIFESWFVDFDPVHAKARGEQPAGMDAETAALFPDSFEKSELGPIPTGWTSSSLASIAYLIKEPIKAGNETLALPYVPIDMISPKNVYLTQTAPSEMAKTSLLRFKRGDVLFGAMRPYFHKVALAPFDGVTRTTTFVLRATGHSFFTLFSLFQESTIAYATNHSQGSTIPYAVWDNGLGSMKMVLPSKTLLDKFEAIVAPLITHAESVLAQNLSLSAILNSLLPRLISGELEIPAELLEA